MPEEILVKSEAKFVLTVKYTDETYAVYSNSQLVIEKIRSLEPFIESCQFKEPAVSIYALVKPISEQIIEEIRQQGVRISIDNSLYKATSSEGFLYEREAGKFFIFILKTETLLYFSRQDSSIFIFHPNEGALSIEANRLLKSLISLAAETKGQLMLHASGIVASDGCTLFLGDSRNGKTSILLDALTHFSVDMLSCDTSFLHIENGEIRARGWPSNFSVSVGTMYDYPCLHSLIPPKFQNLTYAAAWTVYDKYVVDTKDVARNLDIDILPESNVKAMIALNFCTDGKIGLFPLVDKDAIRAWIEKTYLGSRDTLYPNWHQYWSVKAEEIDANIDLVVKAICDKKICFYQMNWAPSATTLLRRVPEIAPLHVLHSGTQKQPIQTVVCAGGVIRHPSREDFIAIVNQQGTSWSLPKGHVEPGESYIQAALREIYEETGIQDLILEKELGSYERTSLSADGSEDRSEMKTIHMFLFRTNTEKLSSIDSANPVAKWVSKEECLKLLTHSKDKEFLAKTMDSLELVDVIDPYTLEITGAIRERAEIYKTGEWHSVFHLWMVNPTRRSLYIQKRSESKLFGNGLLDVTVGGTLRAGEGLEEGIREIEEELCLSIDYKDLIFLERRYHMVSEGLLRNHQVCHVFLYATDLSLQDIRFNSNEVSGLFEIPFYILDQIFENPNSEYWAEGNVYRDGQYVAEKLCVRKDLFVPSIDNYATRIAKLGGFSEPKTSTV